MPEYCVTGGTGFIASHLVKTLLHNGHFVRTTVRNPGTNQNIYIYNFYCSILLELVSHRLYVEITYHIYKDE
ncbi:hypothetical protein F8388_003605 [Cannabis sativa]|uniref:NAD-dependent epimerase/dehydratase domain-containing protein n=1 Tax=Cannabis sativa TaxID=3483 RepID=A0A7J6EMC5_CANSA|nr:hypothetical protein F8388_003605 [Cannabis sativa]